MFGIDEKGLAYLRAEGSEAQIVRTVFGLDAPAAERVAQRARTLRKADNRLSGYADGEVMEREQEQVKLLDDVRTVVGPAPAMHLTDMVAGLAELRPLLYGPLDTSSLASQLRAAGVETGQVYVAGKPRERSSAKGVKHEALEISTTAPIGQEEPESNLRQLRSSS